MRAHGFWRDQFHAYRLWILERRQGTGVVSAPLPMRAEPSQASESVPPAGIELVFLDRKRRGDWARERGADGDWDQYRVALAHDHDLVLALRGTETVGWAWLGYDRVYLPPLGREIRLAPRTAYLYDAYVRPAERHKGIGHALVAARVARADGRDIERLVSHVLVGNAASLQSLRAQGFEVAGRTVFLRALVLRLWTRPPLPAPRAA